MERQPAG